MPASLSLTLPPLGVVVLAPEGMCREIGDFRLKQGRPYPLGATFDGRGVNFALFSAHAKKVELCLFEAGPARKRAPDAARMHRRSLARLSAGRAAGAALRLSRPRAVRSR